MIQRIVLFVSVVAIFFFAFGCNDFNVNPEEGLDPTPYDDQRSLLFEVDELDGKMFIQPNASLNKLTTENYHIFYGSESAFEYEIFTEGENPIATGVFSDEGDTTWAPLDLPKFLAKQELKVVVYLLDGYGGRINTYLPEEWKLGILIGNKKVELIHQKWDDLHNKFVYLFSFSPDKCNCGYRFTQGVYNRDETVVSGYIKAPFSSYTDSLQVIFGNNFPINYITHPELKSLLVMCNNIEYNPVLVSNLSDYQGVKTIHYPYIGVDDSLYHQFYLFIYIGETPTNEDIQINFVGNLPPRMAPGGTFQKDNISVNGNGLHELKHAVQISPILALLKHGIQSGMLTQPPANIINL